MANKRLNDTEALVAKGFAPGSDHSVSVRPIDGGFITRTSSYDPETGHCKSSEVFSKNPPRITPPRMDGRQGRTNGDATGSEGLAGTKAYLGKDV
jgi:hypothetical protein